MSPLLLIYLSHQEYFDKEMAEKIKNRTYRRFEERDIVLQINSKLFFDPNFPREVWGLEYFDTSDDEDNDTDSEGEDGDSEHMFKKMQEEEIKDGNRFTKGLFEAPTVANVIVNATLNSFD